MSCFFSKDHWSFQQTQPPDAGAEQAPATATSAAATSLNTTSPEAKTSKLLPEQEQILLKFFGAQDKVNQEEAAMLARQVQFLRPKPHRDALANYFMLAKMPVC